MAQTVSTASRHWRQAARAALRNPAGPMPTRGAVISDAARMAVPVANGWKLHTAA